MAIAEMLDELKQKALHDPKLKEALLATRKEDQPFAAFCRKCGSWAMRFMRWISLRPEKKPMRPCAGAPTAAERILPCWKVKMIIMSCFCGSVSKGEKTDEETTDR